MKTVLIGQATVCRGLVMGAAILLTFAVSAPRAQAQQDYKQMDLNPKATKWPNALMTDEGRQVTLMLRGGALDGNVFDAFFNTTVFPLFTQWKDQTVRGEVVSPLKDDYTPARMRQRLKMDYLMRAGNAATHERLNELTLKAIEGIAKENYHPVCRANAMIVIAELNSDETAGTPWKQAFPALLAAATSADTIDAVRAAALRGVVRHAQAGLDPATVSQTTTAMLKLLNEQTPPADRTREGHDWMRRRAIDVLVAVTAAAPNPEVVKSLLECVGDEKAWMPVRCDAAAALAKVPFAPPAGASLQDIAKSLGKLAVAVAKTEMDESRSETREISTDLLKRRLDLVRQGLQGTDGRGGILAAAQAADAQQSIRTVLQGIDRLIADSVAPATTRDELAHKIAQAATALETSLDRAAAAPPAGPAAADPLQNPAAANPF